MAIVLSVTTPSNVLPSTRLTMNLVPLRKADVGPALRVKLFQMEMAVFIGWISHEVCPIR